MKEQDSKRISICKMIFITVSSALMVISILLIAYKFFKKYFKVTFECGDCDFSSDEGFFDDADFEPECCFGDEDDSDEIPEIDE